MYRHCRRFRTVAIASICGAGLSACQIAGPVASTANEPDASAPAVQVVTETEPRTITVVREEVSPILTELSLFAKAGKEDRVALLDALKSEYKVNATATNALRYGGALAIIAKGAKTLGRAEALLEQASQGDATGLAMLLMDQTTKRLELLATETEIETPPMPAPSQATLEQVADQNATINRLMLDNTQLRSALTEAEAKIRELAQIETELAKPKKKISP